MLDPKKEAELLRSRFGGAVPDAVPDALTTEPEPEPEPPPPERPKALLLLPVVIGAFVGFSVIDSEGGLIARGGPPIVTTLVERAPLERTIRVSGSIAAQRSASIRAPRIRGRGGGQLTLIDLASGGTRVSKGDLLAEFDRETYIRRLDDIEAQVVQRDAAIKRTKANQSIEAIVERQQLRSAEASLGKARLDVKASEVLSEIRIELAKMAVEQAEADFEELGEEVKLSERARKSALRAVEIDREQTMIDLKRAEINLEQLLIRSPIDGMVVMLSSSRGSDVAEVAKGDQVRSGTYFMQVVDTSAMVLEASVNQVDSQSLRAGMRARVQLDAYPGMSWPARLTSIGAIASSAASGGAGRGRFSRGGGTSYRRELAATFAIEADDPRIIPDLSASADVILEAEEDVVVAPRSAFGTADGQTFAFVRAAGEAGFARRPVEVGVVSDHQVQVLAGLEPGAEIAAIATDVLSQL